MPDHVARTFRAMEEDPTVYGTMNGPSELHMIGSLRDRVPAAEWVLLQDSSHMPHVEEPERFLAVVVGFLARIES